MMDVPIEDSVQFMNIPLSAQALWFHLSIHGEWDGVQCRINIEYARELRRQIGASSEDVRVLMRNELILELEGYIYLENLAKFPGPVVNNDGVKEVVYVDPNTRLEYFRERVSNYRHRSVFDFENA